MKSLREAHWRQPSRIWLAFLVSVLFFLGRGHGAVQSADDDGTLHRWFGPQDWRWDSDRPALALGEKGNFDDQHVFAPHVIQQDREYWMYNSGSQRCVDSGTYKGAPKDPEHPEKSDQRLFKLELCRECPPWRSVLFGRRLVRNATEGIPYRAADPVFSLGDDIHSVVTAAILKNPEGSVHRENGKLRMYFANGMAHWNGTGM